MTTDTFPFEERTIGELVKSQSPVWEPKVWGSVQHVFNSRDGAVSMLKVKAGFRCSRHWHERRCNQFILVSGRIEVWSWANEGELTDWPNPPTRIEKMSINAFGIGRRSVSVPAGTPHMFVVRESGIVVEIYTPDGGPVDIDDIVRFDEGGPV